MYVSVYKKVKKRSGTWDWVTYKTKSHTAMHQSLRKRFNAMTYKDPTVLLTHLVGGMLPLDEPIVKGERVGGVIPCPFDSSTKTRLVVTCVDPYSIGCI